MQSLKPDPWALEHLVCATRWMGYHGKIAVCTLQRHTCPIFLIFHRSSSWQILWLNCQFRASRNPPTRYACDGGSFEEVSSSQCNGVAIITIYRVWTIQGPIPTAWREVRSYAASSHVAINYQLLTTAARPLGLLRHRQGPSWSWTSLGKSVATWVCKKNCGLSNSGKPRLM
jgi:hypothetical protein